LCVNGGGQQEQQQKSNSDSHHIHLPQKPDQTTSRLWSPSAHPQWRVTKRGAG
jgi:hypothetical protein